MQAAIRVRTQTLTSGPRHHFFGYYGVSPWNRSGRSMICLESDFHNRMPRPGEKARIVVVNPTNGACEAVTETGAWNLQQGCMLHWNPLEPEHEFLFNDLADGEIISAAHHRKTGKRRTWPRAIESVASNGRYATCVTYGRLARLRPVVGYAAARDPNPTVNHPDNDGVFLLDLASGSSRLAVSMAQVYDALAARHPELKTKALFFQHTVINPDSSRFFFLARTIENGRLTSAMFTAGLQGEALREVVPYGRGVSHFAWRGNSEIMATFNIDGKVRHVLFEDRAQPEYKVVAPEHLDSDGHCSFGGNPDLLVTDKNIATPAAKKLLFYDLRRNELVEAGTFPMAAPDGEQYLSGDTRCDLHPRWKRSGDQVCFDALDPRTWTRQLHIATIG
jgi:hypothetical protein